MFKIHILIGALIISASQITAQSENPLPADAQSVRISYFQARERAIQPLLTKYKGELERLMNVHTKAGRLDEALAIRKEIESLEIHSGKGSAERAGTDAQTKKELEKSLIGTQWAISKQGATKPHELVTFLENGKATMNNRPTEPWKWEALQKRVVKLGFVELKFSDDLSSFSATWGDQDVTGMPAQP